MNPDGVNAEPLNVAGVNAGSANAGPTTTGPTTTGPATTDGVIAGAVDTEPINDAGAAAREALRRSVRRYYTDRLERGDGCCGDTCGCGASESDEATPSFGCGLPTVFADLAPGEDVLDLGSGAGLDAFRAAEAVGASGTVTGVDMTPAMLERARAGAQRLASKNVRFLEGTIEHLPLPDASVDVVLSNCVVNLSADKPAVFREAHRVLRPGGRLAISDILRHGERLTAATEAGWCACVDGAEAAEAYRGHLAEAGFIDIEIDEPPSGVPVGDTYSASIRGTRADPRPARAADLPAIRALLEAADLPTDGLDAEHVHLHVLSDAAEIAGVVGLEAYGENALLRSLVVREGARGRGLGRALIRHAEREARARGAGTAFALTTTIPRLLDRLGYERVERRAVPAPLFASPELRGACPSHAGIYRRSLDGSFGPAS